VLNNHSIIQHTSLMKTLPSLILVIIVYLTIKIVLLLFIILLFLYLINKDCIAFVYNTFVSVSDQHIVILLSDDSVDLCISFKQGVNVRHNWKPFCAT
jgi:hypothetical protein